MTVSDIDAHYAHAKANGAQIVMPLAETSYGAREYSARDIEGHLWSFGTYDPQGTSHASSSSASAESEMIEQFQKIEDNFNAAMISNDCNRIAECITEDWCLVTPEKGPVRGADVLAAIKAGVLSHDTMTKKVARVAVYADLAAVTGRGQNSGLFRGEPISADEWITDVYRMVNGKWRCVLTHLTLASGI